MTRSPMKVLEVLDRHTFIPVLAVNINPANDAQLYLMRRCGYPCDWEPNILLTRLSADGSPAWNDPYGWGGRTFPVAHNWIIENWNTLSDGDVVDVEFILGETKAPKERGRREQKARGAA
jgi:hypothetical protein